MNSNVRRLVSVTLCLLFLTTVGCSEGSNSESQSTEETDSYVEITSPTPIYTEPSFQADEVGNAESGLVVEMAKEKDGWYVIYLFSGEYRYVPKSSAKWVQYTPSFPDGYDLPELQEAMGQIEDEAMRKADREYPPSKQLDKNIRYQRILTDRLKLEHFQRRGWNPPDHDKILEKMAESLG